MLMKLIKSNYLPFVALSLFVAMLTNAGWAQTTANSSGDPSLSQAALRSLEKNVHVFRLANGLRTVFIKRRGAPVFAGQVWVRVGGVDESPGLTGVSHMLEHMAFKGTSVIGTTDFDRESDLLEELDESMSGDSQNKEGAKEIEEQLRGIWVDNEFSETYELNGATGLNAATSKDFTYYTVSLPSSRFELWCLLESERLLHPVFRQFYKERDVVMEERRMRVTDSPWGLMYESLLATAYMAHPNRLPVIGWDSDVSKLKRSDLVALHQRFYRPDNIVLAISGDLNLEDVQRKVADYFGDIPKAEGDLPRVKTVEPPQTGPRRAVVEFDAEPALFMGYHKPVYPDSDDARFAILHILLGDGRTSLLQRKLVEQAKVATHIYTTEAPGELYPSLFVVGAVPADGVSTEILTQAIQEVFDTLKQEAVGEELIQTAKRKVLISLYASMRSNSGLASMLAKNELLWGDWKVIYDMFRDIEGTTPADIKKMASSYLNESNRTVVYLSKPGSVR